MTFSKSDRQAYGHGLRCAQAGGNATSNPYSAESGLGRSWASGHAKGATMKRRYTPDASDLAYEDQCASMCGPGL
jgi:hypothetical protein